MFARSHRFSFRKGAPRKIFPTPFFIVRYDRSELENLECAVVVGKKVDKRAVIRNKTKRQIVAAIKQSLPEQAPYRIVIIAKKSIQDLSVDLLREELMSAFKKINIL